MPEDKYKAAVDTALKADVVPLFPGAQAPPDDAAPLMWLDMSMWDAIPVPEREWAITNRAPLRQVGLFSGEGGVGKSIIELTKDVAHVIGGDWFGSLPKPGPAFYIGAEDEVDEIHRRLNPICAHYSVTFGDIAPRNDGGLHVLPMLGKDATLCAVNGKSGRVEVTSLYNQLHEAAGDIKPVNISLDTLSRVFSGSEIDRVQVYAFAMHMQALAQVANGSVTVLSHPSLAGISSGSGISGSTAWHGAFRFRHYLTSAKAEAGEQPDDEMRELTFKKNQYGPRGESVIVRWQNGMFLPEAGVSSLDRAARDGVADSVFLDVLRRFTREGRNASDNRFAPTFAPAAFAKEPEATKHRLKKMELEAAMRRLFSANKLHVEPYGKASLGRTRLALR